MSTVRAASLGLLLAVCCAARADPATTPQAVSERVALALKNGVVRVQCDTLRAGSGFVHSSGNVVTAAHVIFACASLGKPIWIIDTAGKQVLAGGLTTFALQPDVAVLTPATALSAHPLSLSKRETVEAGLLVAFAGFPRGHVGNIPRIGVGSALGNRQVPLDLTPYDLPKSFVPAEPVVLLQIAFSGDLDYGNSGGPLVDAETGEVVGLVLTMTMDRAGKRQGIGGAAPARFVADEVDRFLRMPKLKVPAATN